MLQVSRVGIMALAVFAAGCSIVSSTASRTDSEFAPSPPTMTGAPVKGLQEAVFAGGCFWGVEAVFEHVKGVTDARSGYTGGTEKDADYDKVSAGKTGHAEAVQVTFDPSKVTYVQLLTIFFSVAHDSTEVDRQGPDVGKQYRSEIFYLNDEQKKLAADFIAAIDKAKVLAKPVATKVSPLTEFFEAEKYHQDFARKNPTHPYIVHHDLPKVAALKERFPDLYVEKK